MYRTQQSVRTRIRNWANSLRLRIPRALAEKIGVRVGQEVGLSACSGALSSVRSGRAGIP